ncbi:cation channel sperm-associated protein 4-like [Erpetoichthys calabaricus]|uniref:cation channel sperm-associated protein 4-like n=1 Tax=Erpetoichthys calabaricus TaxID=27687 RepID=UPI002234028E|nr:cation channel sperm-associated protein 4-like [Erpetoichthys calabaricus]
MAMHIAGIYFFLFVTSGSFVFANILVAVVTTNLEIAMDDYMKQCAIEQKKKGKESDGLVHLSIEETSKQVPLMGEPCIQDPIENLDIEKFENLTFIIQLMKDNMEEYITFRQELDRIIQEVQELPVNQGRQEEMMRRHQMMRKLSDSVLKDSVASGRSGDVLSTLIMLEKANVINTELDFVVKDSVRRRPR